MMMVEVCDLRMERKSVKTKSGTVPIVLKSGKGKEIRLLVKERDGNNKLFYGNIFPLNLRIS